MRKNFRAAPYFGALPQFSISDFRFSIFNRVRSPPAPEANPARGSSVAMENWKLKICNLQSADRRILALARRRGRHPIRIPAFPQFSISDFQFSIFNRVRPPTRERTPAAPPPVVNENRQLKIENH